MSGPIQPVSHSQEDFRLKRTDNSSDDSAKDVDIIAIHGLDTKSPDTWIYKTKDGRSINWLADADMLPGLLPNARIFTCDWPAKLFNDSALVPKLFDECARLLLEGIRSRLPAATETPGRKQPIVFIASCLGGIILARALTLITESSDYMCIRRATKGFVFLATPFRGTSFKNVAWWAMPLLQSWAALKNETVSLLLDQVVPSFERAELVRSFTALCRNDNIIDNIALFYETGKTSLSRKALPFMPERFFKSEPVGLRYPFLCPPSYFSFF